LMTEKVRDPSQLQARLAEEVLEPRADSLLLLSMN